MKKVARTINAVTIIVSILGMIASLCQTYWLVRTVKRENNE